MIEVTNVSHSYGSEQVLHNLSFKIKEGEFVFLSGDSGSGKSTLLSILSTLLQPSSGEVRRENISTCRYKNIDIYRQKNIGFVFQFHYLINYLSVYDNIALAALEDKKTKINSLLEELGILDLSDKYPNEISGGERQRVAIARALINNPKIIFADEPTGSLDSTNSQLVYEILRRSFTKGTTVVVASHDMKLQEYATSTIKLVDGRI
ncbi:ABC transporter ATP-binding protein [Sulfurimonas sp.]|nr:ABC transporter ATP-binding protein [Sulfurimonas sp.]